MKNLILISVFIGNLIFNNCISQSTRVATLVADAFLSEAAPSSNWGNDALVPLGLEPDGRVCAPIFKFDLGSFTGQVHVHSAELKLYYYPGIPVERVVGEVFRITQSWSESSVTWNNAPNTSFFDQYFFAGTGGTSLSINMTPIVKQWLEEGRSNHGFGLSPFGIIDGEITPDGNACFFYTKEGSSTYKPKLTFQYSYLDVGPDIQGVINSSGATEFHVSTNVGWSVSDDASWLTATKVDGSTISVLYDANTSTSSRTAHITVITSDLSETVNVFQSGSEAYIDVSPNNLEVNSSSGTSYFNVSSNVIWDVSDDASWLTSTKTDDGTITVSYNENSSTSSRTANITASSGGIFETVTLTQSGIALYLDVNPNSKTVGSSPGTTTYNVNSNVVWSVSDDVSWLTATKTNESTITVTYDENPYSNSRTGHISASGSGVSENVSLIQSGSEAYLDVSPNTREVNSSSGTTSFNVSANVYWDVSDDASWLTATKTDDYTITINYNENTSTNSRTSNITVNGTGGLSEVVTVVQNGTFYINVSPNSKTVNSSSGTATFEVSSNVVWSVSDDASWLTATKVDGSTISVSYDANSSTNSRTANITASGSGVSETVTLTQSEPDAVTLYITPDYQEVPPDAGSIFLSINSNSGWEISDDAEWLTVNPFEGIYDDTITATFTRNDSESSRIATIFVSSGEINVSAVIIQNSSVNGIEIDGSLNSVQVYPNPVNEVLFICHNSNKLSFRMTSLSGQVISESENVPSYFEFSLPEIKPGMYLLQFIADKSSFSQKIIVE
jgi:hypothetical protein